jgi:acyl-CoA synthetase (AMP-forming)/AMP-acid ligase II
MVTTGAAIVFSFRLNLWEAGTHGETHRNWRDYEDRSARLASALVGAGLKPDAKTAIYAHNSAAYLEAQFASFKARTVPINVNYRYVEHELSYLFDNGDVEAVFFDARFAHRLASIRDRLPDVKLFIRIDDGTDGHLDGALDFEGLIASNPPLPRLDYSEDDIYMIYTGGTTGMPKGVMSVGVAIAVLGSRPRREFDELAERPVADSGRFVLLRPAR